MRISDWSSDVCSSDLRREGSARAHGAEAVAHQRPGGDAFGDLAVDQEGRRALDVVLLGRGAGCVLQLLDRVDIGEAAIDLLSSEEHTSELQSLMRISYAVFCLKKKMTI